MLVKELVKELLKVDQNLPVVSWSFKIGKENDTYGGITEKGICRPKIIFLKKKTPDKKSAAKNIKMYEEATKSDKKVIKALHLFGK